MDVASDLHISGLTNYPHILFSPSVVSHIMCLLLSSIVVSHSCSAKLHHLCTTLHAKVSLTLIKPINMYYIDCTWWNTAVPFWPLTAVKLNVKIMCLKPLRNVTILIRVTELLAVKAVYNGVYLSGRQMEFSLFYVAPWLVISHLITHMFLFFLVCWCFSFC